MLRSPRWLFLVPVVSLITGCGGGGGGGDAFGGIHCAGLTGGSAAAGSNGAGGTRSQTYTDAAADHDLGTYAILEMADSASGDVHIRVTAQDGVTYPAGTPAAVVYGLTRTAGDSLNTAETITTYLDGTMQQTGPANAPNGTTSGDVDAERRSIVTSLPFDAIEFAYAQSGGTADVEVHVYEFCTSVD